VVSLCGLGCNLFLSPPPKNITIPLPITQADHKRALSTYDALLDLQIQRFPDDGAKQAVARAETLKLIGNVYVAMRHWNRYDGMLNFIVNCFT